MKKLILTSLFVFALLISYASASSYELKLDQVDEKLLVNYLFTLDSEQTLSFSIQDDAYSLSSNLNYSKTNDIITIRGKDIKFSYLTKALLDKFREGYYFVKDIEFPSDFSDVKISLTLKEGYFLENDKIFPEPSSIETDGRQISVNWEFKNAKTSDKIPIFVTIEKQSGAFSITILIIVIIALLISALYLLNRLKKTKIRKLDIESHLIDAEKLVLSELKKADRGELWQKQLQLKTNFSKAKLSRLIRNLEQRNLIEKIPFGNTNKVRIK